MRPFDWLECGKSMLDKIERFNKDLAGVFLDRIQMNYLVREFWMQMAHIKIEHEKANEKARLSDSFS